MRCQEVVLRRTSLEEQVTERYRDVELGKVVYEYHLRTLFGAEEEKRATELRGLIERMGEINLTAIEESEELQKRFDFLTAQKTRPRIGDERSSRPPSSASTGRRGGASGRRSTRSTRSSRRCSRACSAAGAPAWC